MTPIHEGGSKQLIFDGYSEAGGDVLIIAGRDRSAAAKDAVRDAGGTLLGCLDWDEGRIRLEQQSHVRLVLAEAHGADPAAMVRVLPVLDTLARNGDAQVVLTFDLDQIDLITANVSAPDVQLLCDPAPHERFLALYLAGMTDGVALHDSGREAEAVRLQRLNEEVARIAETLARLTRGDVRPRADAVGDRVDTYRAPPMTSEAPDIPARDVREAIRARRLRDQFFGGGLFEDPAWDMLLDLFAAELERTQVSVSSLCIAAAVAPTTALRWITRMTEAGLFQRQPDPFDRRRAFMGLSDRASAGMRNYVAAVQRTGAAIA